MNSSSVIDFAELPTCTDLSSDKMMPGLTGYQLPRKCPPQTSRISLNNIPLQTKSDQTSTHNGALTERTDHTDLASGKQNSSQLNAKQFHIHFSQTQNKQNRNPDLKTVQSNGLQRLKRVAITIINLNKNIIAKILAHLSKNSTADKYLRLLYSILKLYRALNQKNNLGQISKEILTARRIIQWESKYQLIQELRDQNLSNFDFGYKIFQLIGNLFDFGSFWMHFLAGDRKQFISMAQTMYSWQDDCYFYQCVIELTLSTKNLIKNLSLYLNQSYSEDKKFQALHKLVAIDQVKNQLQMKLNRMKTLNKQHESPNSQIRQIFLQKMQQKISQKQTESSEIQESYNEWRQNQEKKIRKQIIKSSLKICKYLCDVRTSYNNYSGKAFGLDPVVGGTLSIVSSLFSMSLIWNF